MSTTMLVTLVPMQCADCGIPFGISDDFMRRRREDHNMFKCPSGHGNHFPHETEEEKLRKKVAQLQTDIEHKEARISTLREATSQLERSRAALKGVHTRVCNRIKNGVCPCCNRTFQNLAAHIHSKHPDFKTAE